MGLLVAPACRAVRGAAQDLLPGRIKALEATGLTVVLAARLTLVPYAAATRSASMAPRRPGQGTPPRLTVSSVPPNPAPAAQARASADHDATPEKHLELAA
jgi:hypothetical protein